MGREIEQQAGKGKGETQQGESGWRNQVQVPTWIVVLNGPIHTCPMCQFCCEGRSVGGKIWIYDVYDLRLRILLAEVHISRFWYGSIIIYVGEEQEKGSCSSGNRRT